MKNHSPQLLLAIALIGLMGSAQAVAETVDAATPESMRSAATCHTLMTKQECGKFKTTLEQLNPGPARDRYLAEHNFMMQERETACRCNPKVLAGTFYPPRRQALLRF